jgi:hypothetical protein
MKPVAEMSEEEKAAYVAGLSPAWREAYDALNSLSESEFAAVEQAVETTWFAVGDRAAHEGYVTSRIGPPWPAEGGWTEQDVTGAHGHILYEGDGPSAEAEAWNALEEFLQCDAEEEGRYCYAHNREGR